MYIALVCPSVRMYIALVCPSARMCAGDILSVPRCSNQNVFSYESNNAGNNAWARPPRTTAESPRPAFV